jgi:ribosome biogenesis protein Nip4
MNQKQAKRARRQVYGKNDRRNPFQYGSFDGKTIVCQGLRQQYQKLKQLMKRMQIRISDS